MNKNHSLKTILITPLIGLTIFIIVGYLAFSSIVSTMTNEGQCGGLLALMCFFVALPSAVAMALLAEVSVACLLLKKADTPHFIAIPIFTTMTALALVYVIAGLVQGMVFLWITFGLAYLLLFLFYYWYFAMQPGGFGSKVLRSIVGIVALLILGVLIYYYF